MPMKSRALARACVQSLAAAALIAGTGSAFAANLGFLNDTPISYMKQRDLQALNSAARTALDTQAGRRIARLEQPRRGQSGADQRHHHAARTRSRMASAPAAR